MNVGSINNVNAYSAGFGLPPARPVVNNAPPVPRSQPAAVEKAPEPALSHGAVRYYSAQGDSVDISGEAMDLWRNMMAGNNASPNPAGSMPRGSALPESPSPLIDWDRLPDKPAPGVAPPDAAPPRPQSDLPEYKLPDGILPGGNTGEFEVNPLEPKGECKTCASRRYVDKSNDASVSFQTPTKVNSNSAMAAVASHENEHVRNERSKARREDREIVSQTVTLTFDCCPECGRSYVSGGTTRTASVSKSDAANINNSDTGGDAQLRAESD